MHDKIGAGLRLSCSYDEDMEAEKGVGQERWNGAKLKVWEAGERAGDGPGKGRAPGMAGDALPRFSSHSQHASLVPPEAKLLNNERHGWLTGTP